MKNKFLPYWCVAIGSVFIGFSAIFVKIIPMPSTVVGYYRMLFGALGLFIIGIIRREKYFHSWGAIGFAALAGFFLAIDVFSWQVSIRLIGPGLATIIGNLQIFILAAVGILIYKETVNWKFYIALPLALFGLYLLVGFHWQTFSMDYRSGVYFGLLAALTYGLYTTTLRHSHQLDNPNALKPIPNITWVSLFSALCLGLAAKFQHESFSIPTSHDWVLLLNYALFGQLLGWLFILIGLPYLRISIAGFLLLLQPICSFVLDIVIFHRSTPLHEWIGVIITLLAIYLSLVARITKT